MNKKYQVFVSSTYEDLIEERKLVSNALLESDCIPAGMELFPAANKESWEVIKSVIDDCDYYLLIIAGKYGSLGKDDSGNKCGFTEMEYNYAKSIGKPIIAFIHNDIGNIVSAKVEPTKAGKKRLERFSKKVKSNSNVKFWANPGELISNIKSSLTKLIEECPADGWIKGNEIYEISPDDNPLMLGLKKVYTNVENINYNDIIQNTKQYIDIVHIHGMTWTNSNRNALKNKLKDEDITIRVVLLDNRNIFFNPYADFIGQEGKYLNNKTAEVLDIWKAIYNEATSNGKKSGAKLFIYFHDGFPSKSLYRFDNQIISNPAVMTKSKSPMMPTVYCEKNENPNCLFNVYFDEINWLIDNSIDFIELSKK